MSAAVKTPLKDLYESDLIQWTEETARLIRERAFDELDTANLATEIEDMGKRDRRELRSRLRVLLTHLLKWQFQPEKRSPSWIGTIDLQREEIATVLEESLSLRGELERLIEKTYVGARKAAYLETDLPLQVFPDACAFSIDQLLDQSFLPD